MSYTLADQIEDSIEKPGETRIADTTLRTQLIEDIYTDNQTCKDNIEYLSD